MEILDSPDEHEHRWLRWVGLGESPEEADSWVPIVRGLTVDRPETGLSDLGTVLVESLKEAGIEARQRSYELTEPVPMAGVIAGGTGLPVTRVAVLVRNRDREKATEIAVAVNSATTDESGVSDDELTREALEAGPPPED